jgi:homoserine O-acetyltransferase
VTPSTHDGTATPDAPPHECGRASLGAFEFACGQTLPELTVAYETYGEYDGDNAVLVCHALTGSARVADGETQTAAHDDDAINDDDQARAWWDGVVGPGKAIDTRESFVVCANVPGSCYGTTGPASTNPETGEPYGSDFPPVTVGDWTRAQRRLLDSLSVDALRAVVGGSVGGMNAIDWAKRYPDRVEAVAAIATAPRLGSQILALDAVARRAITTDPAWEGGDYYGDEPDPDDGLATARRLGHVTYLSKDSMAERFGRESAERAGSDGLPPFAADAFAGGAFGTAEAGGTFGEGDITVADYREVESYLDYQADRFTERFDANSYLLLTRAMDEYDLAAGHESDADALAGFDGEALVVSFTGDWHFTVEGADALADAFRTAGAETCHRVVDSDYGHDAFLVEPDPFAADLAGLLDGGVERATGSGRRTGAQAPVHASLISD